jgi:methylmalonyl-CoA/ethylmalonyl-CoA epimerase
MLLCHLALYVVVFAPQDGCRKFVRPLQSGSFALSAELSVILFSTLDQYPETQFYDLHEMAKQRGYEIVERPPAGTRRHDAGCTPPQRARRWEFPILRVWSPWRGAPRELTLPGLFVIVPEGEEYPMGVFAFHHVGIAVRDLAKSMPIYRTLFDYELVSGPFDDPVQNVSVCFLSRGEGDTLLELVAPLGPKSPIDRTLKMGGGPYHICYQVQDINAAIAYLTEQGAFLVSGPSPAVAFEMREIAWLMTAADLLVELVQE